MKIIVCVKQVPDTETRVRIAPDGQRHRRERRQLGRLALRRVRDRGGPADQGEAGRGGRARGASAPTGSQTALRNGLAMGADSARAPQGPALRRRRTPLGTARALAAAIKGLAPFDLVLTGQQGVGGDHSQVPGLLAELLDLPQVTWR